MKLTEFLVAYLEEVLKPHIDYLYGSFDERCCINKMGYKFIHWYQVEQVIILPIRLFMHSDFGRVSSIFSASQSCPFTAHEELFTLPHQTLHYKYEELGSS